MPSRPDEWQHYRIRYQHIGTSAGVGNPFVWTRVWEVRRPWGHADMQRDDWEKVAYKRFDTHDEAVRWASAEAIKDKVRSWWHEYVDNNIDELITIARDLEIDHA